MLVSNTLRYGLARGVSGLLNLLALALFTRVLGKEGYGWYALTIAAAGLAYAALFQWLSLGAVRLLHAGVAPRLQFQTAVLRAFLRVSAVAVAGTMLAFAVVPASIPRGFIAGAGALLVCQAWYELNLMIATADGQPGRYGVLAASRSFVGLMLGGALGLGGFGPLGVLVGVCTGYLLPGLWLARTAWPAPWQRAESATTERALLQYGAPLVAAYVLDYMVSSSDRLLLGVLVGPGSAGSYAAAYELSQQAIWSLMMVVNLAAFPLAVAAAQSADRQELPAAGRRHIGMLLGIGIPAATGLAVLAPGISALMFAKEIAEEAAPLIPLISLAVLLGGIKAYYFDLSFQLGRATLQQLAVVAITALSNLALNLAWIPALGARGAALATLCAYLIGLGLSIALGRRVLRMPFAPGDAVRVLLAAGGMAAALCPFRGATSAPSLALQVVGGGLLYITLVFILNPLDVRGALAQRWGRSG